MSHHRVRRFQRRHHRTYPLPERGMRYAELNASLLRKDVDHAVRGGDVIRPGYGLYTPVKADPHDQLLATLQALCRGTPHLMSHSTAGALWGMIDDALAPPFHITSPQRGSRVKRPGLVTAHRSTVAKEDQHQIREIPLTSPARTWVDVATSLPLLEALILADRCRRRGRLHFGEAAQPLASGAELTAALNRRGRTRGIVTARQALRLSRDGVDSPMETMLRLFMHQAGLPDPGVNEWICDEHGNPILQPDLSIWEYRLAIQYEGWEYHSDPDQMAKDIRRQERTEALGWLEVRITKEHMRNGGAAAIAKIVQALRRQGWKPGKATLGGG